MKVKIKSFLSVLFIIGITVVVSTVFLINIFDLSALAERLTKKLAIFNITHK